MSVLRLQTRSRVRTRATSSIARFAIWWTSSSWPLVLRAALAPQPGARSTVGSGRRVLRRCHLAKKVARLAPAGKHDHPRARSMLGDLRKGKDPWAHLAPIPQDVPKDVAGDSVVRAV